MGPIVADVAAEWVAFLAMLERDVEREEVTPGWLDAKPSGPLPAGLADRALEVVGAQQQLVERLASRRDDVRGQSDAAARVPTDGGAPAFIDIQG